MDEIIIRKLTKEDVFGAAEIKVNGWKQAYKGIIDDEYLDSLSIEKHVKRFNDCIGNDDFIVAILNQKVVGFCRFMYDNSFSKDIDYIDCEIGAIYVHPDFKGRGIGKKMFNYVLNEFSNKNTMILWCLADNIDSINFYKHMGGKIKESKLVQIGNKEYKEVGIVYTIN